MKYKNKIGIIQEIKTFFEDDGLVDFLSDIGIETLQLNSHDVSLMTDENADKLLKMTEGKLEITSVWCGWSGPKFWNFIDGPDTLGLVPLGYRSKRLDELKKGADFAKKLGVHDMATHVGFVPEQPCYPEYRGVVSVVRDIARYCKERDLHFNFETGQETPVTLMRLFSDVGEDNLGINLDPANLIMYGRGNPIDALGIYGDKIRGIHVKDGDYPKGDFHRLGKERVVGEGSVNFPVFLPKLLDGGYKGDLYIEHEISDADRAEDVKKTVKYIKALME